MTDWVADADGPRYIAGMPNIFLVMAGGAIGAGIRYLVSIGAAARWGSLFPWGTLAVNLGGGLLMGLLAGAMLRGGADERGFLLLGTGVLGGFTTFSAFSLETARMIEQGELMMAASYSLASVIGSVTLLFVGLMTARAVAA